MGYSWREGKKAEGRERCKLGKKERGMGQEAEV